jgi:hypothetical protein
MAPLVVASQHRRGARRHSAAPAARDARIALAGGLVLVVAVAAIVLSRSPPVVARTNGLEPNAVLAATPGGGSVCQAGETLPAGSTAVGVSLEASSGPRVTLRVVSPKGAVVTRGVSASGWVGKLVTVPVKPMNREVRDAVVCLSFSGADERISLLGTFARSDRATWRGGSAIPGRLAIVYFRDSSSSWWSLARSVVRRMGLGRAWTGGWVAIVVAVLLAGSVVLAVWLLVQDADGPAHAEAVEERFDPRRKRVQQAKRRPSSKLWGVPRAAWLCALVACLNAAAWSLLMPPFQVPDEQAHFAYVEQLAKAHRLPSSSAQAYAFDEAQALEDLQVGRVSLQPEYRTIASVAQQRKLEADLASARASPPGPGGAGVAASQPPLYYALEAVPYELGAGGSVLDQQALMRLMSALMAGATTLFVFLFLREAMPSARSAWIAASLGVAFLPLLGFMSGAVNPDAMLYALSAALFYSLARGFRRGLTGRLAIAIGALTAAGFLTKLNFLGLVPGVVFGLALLARRASVHVGVGIAARTLALALVVAASPACVYVFVNVFSHHRALGIVSGVIASTAGRHSLLSELGYIWQLYLPRLPGMHADFADISPMRDIWFNGLVGEYGFQDTFFPRWVDNIALIPTVGISALCARELFACRSVLLGRASEICVYAAMAAGLLLLIGASSYMSFPVEAAAFPEPRYLMPLVPLFGGVLALTARGAGRRLAPAAGSLIVVLFVAHDIFSQFQVIARYYG